PSMKWLENVRDGLRESLERGDSFYREYSHTECGQTKKVTSGSEIAFKVIVITDSCNVSAALDFIDELKMMNIKVVLIGRKTKADRLYMELRSLPLPSGGGTLFFPIKVYRNRQRLDNEPYIPNIEFKDAHNTHALQSFILEIIRRNEFGCYRSLFQSKHYRMRDKNI
ncbi:MAG: hypothetical protein Q8K36_07110, partial [Alphaproteobacteria bacterium]|nr:hypothetical protein [Alphaproteobacteria bacterium]